MFTLSRATYPAMCSRSPQRACASFLISTRSNTVASLPPRSRRLRSAKRSAWTQRAANRRPKRQRLLREAPLTPAAQPEDFDGKNVVFHVETAGRSEPHQAIVRTPWQIKLAIKSLAPMLLQHLIPKLLLTIQCTKTKEKSKNADWICTGLDN